MAYSVAGKKTHSLHDTHSKATALDDAIEGVRENDNDKDSTMETGWDGVLHGAVRWIGTSSSEQPSPELNPERVVCSPDSSDMVKAII